MIKNKNIKLMGVFASVLLIIIVITASFAYFGSFNVNLNNNIAVNVNSVSPGNAIFTSNATQLNLQVPAANMSLTASNNTVAASSNTATLSVSLTSGSTKIETTCTYDIVYEYDSSSYIYGGTGTNHVSKNGDKEITLQVSEVNGTNNFASEKNFDYDSNWSGLKRTLVSGATIESDGTLTTQNISITGKYYNLTISQSSLEGKSFIGKIYVTNNKCETAEKEPTYLTLLEAYGGEGKIVQLNNTAFNNVTTANDEGVYKATDDLGISYYYRGAVNNNWVKFGKDVSSKDMYWRIIRINGDGSIRMIYSGVTDPSTDSSVKNSNGVLMTESSTSIGDDWLDGDKSEYVGYQYILGQQHGYGKCDGAKSNCTIDGVTIYNSVAKQTIDKWYAKTTLASTDSVKVADAIYCNDRSASSTQTSAWASTGVVYYYGAYERLTGTTQNPILTCPTASDKFTVNTSNGNGALTYPVGLITADELVMAGNKYNTSNQTLYLYSNSFFASGTPSHYDSEAPSTFYQTEGSSSGGFNNVPAGSGFRPPVFSTRPVISLSSNVKLSGNGTYDNPYIVE